MRGGVPRFETGVTIFVFMQIMHEVRHWAVYIVKSNAPLAAVHATYSLLVRGASACRPFPPPHGVTLFYFHSERDFITCGNDQKIISVEDFLAPAIESRQQIGGIGRLLQNI